MTARGHLTKIKYGGKRARRLIIKVERDTDGRWHVIVEDESDWRCIPARSEGHANEIAKVERKRRGLPVG